MDSNKFGRNENNDMLFARESFGNISLGVTMGVNAETGGQVFQFNEDRFRHLLILGRTGTGKSNHIMQMEREDIISGAGVAIIASHEEDAIYPLTWVPEDRMDDVVLLDASNTRYVACMNPLDVDVRDKAAVSKAIDDTIELLKTDCHYEWAGPQFERMARMGLGLILHPAYPNPRCIGELERLFNDCDYVTTALNACNDDELRTQWRLEASARRASDHGETVQWFLSKVSGFVSDEVLKNVFGPGKATIDLDDIVCNGKILVAIIPEARIGKEASHAIAAWLTARLKDAILKRGKMLENVHETSSELGIFAQRIDGAEKLEPFFVYIDEFAKVASPEFGAMLAESRKYHVGFVLSLQTLAQAKVQDMRAMRESTLLQTMLGNVGSVVCYPMGPFDTMAMADFMGVSPAKVKDIQRYRPLAQLCMDNDQIEPIELEVPVKPEPGRESTPRRI
ncbi:MAG: hypothetical protein J5818_05720, partial [Eggerthellaceae bacterium]|nr:hypothetical protein [Eggerthellaceae bacterium]